jgi:hypothetical protein
MHLEVIVPDQKDTLLLLGNRSVNLIVYCEHRVVVETIIIRHNDNLMSKPTLQVSSCAVFLVSSRSVWPFHISSGCRANNTVFLVSSAVLKVACVYLSLKLSMSMYATGVDFMAP